MQVYKSQFLHLAFFAQEELIEMTWLPATEHMTDEECKQEFRHYLDLMLQLKPKKVLPDTRDMLFQIDPDLQEWTNHTIFTPSLAMGLNKAAFVVSQYIFAQVAIEQTMGEQEGSKFNTRYFDNKEAAKAWLLLA
ncbi:MAG: STAS/SEC14 domain-containing protein [Bernardetiaceae bacterium]|jgi:hypothetical protein|nr:STAS/SEC14 domain-containing protein [Bernardetiaceae bacterium]